MNAQVIVTILVFLVMGIFAIQKLKNRNEFSFAFLYYIITISLVSNIIFLIGATKAERFLYGPSLAFCLLIGIAGYKYLKEKLFLVIIGVLFAFYSIRTIARNADWKNNFILFQKDVTASPHSANTHYNYGILYMDSIAMKASDPELKRSLLAVPLNEFLEAVHIDSLAGDAYKDLGNCYFYLEEYSKSIESSRRALEINPTDYSIDVHLGIAYFRNNQFHEAIEALNKAINEGFVESNTYNYLGSAYFKTGDYLAAIASFNKSLENNPADEEEALINLGSAYASVHDYEKAIRSFNKSLEINPSNAQAYRFLSIIYKDKGDIIQADSCLEKAKQLDEAK